MKYSLFLVALLVAGCAPEARPQSPAAQRVAELTPEGWPYFDGEHVPASGARGMVATEEALAAGVGAALLGEGGNAVDAAIAAFFALAVTYPEAGNLGGGGFLLVRMADGQRGAVDFRESAPLAASRDMFLGDTLPANAALHGYLAVAVPGSVAGMWEAHRRFGTRPWAELLAPAIRLAEEGFSADERYERVLGGKVELLSRFPESAALFLDEGRAPEAGSLVRNPELAATLRRIAEHGAHDFYHGETAELLVAQMRRGGGLITHEDLASYRARWREPVVIDYRGHELMTMPPAAAGGVALGIIAAILEGYPLGELGWHSPESLHITAEAMRRAFAVTNQLVGDPEFVEAPFRELFSPEHARRQREGIDADRATPSDLLSPALEGAGEGAREGGAHGGIGGDAAGGDHTVHISVVDAWGNAVALTTTLNDLYGSGVTVGGAGFVLNGTMDDFAIRPGEPDDYGLVRGEAHAIEPGKRAMSTQAPSIVSDSLGVLLVTGARGGPRIVSAVWQVISNVVDHRLPLDLAVLAPRIHHQHLPDELHYESGGLREEELRALEALGHLLRPRGGVGSAPSILRVKGGWEGLADPRTGGLAEGR